ncbi:hypothetical protein Pmani_029614 [Petrolisthes manimaculis]|uniref:Uncharacterized protein n=1 Tax=Petrolisthes manimaculis TaxID=1843537 RepID=A0AAE1TWT0_9EUCA|nr:hypothetical protein Pmani_029614 [Petrolisthes manimaculis]
MANNGILNKSLVTVVVAVVRLGRDLWRGLGRVFGRLIQKTCKLSEVNTFRSSSNTCTLCYGCHTLQAIPISYICDLCSLQQEDKSFFNNQYFQCLSKETTHFAARLQGKNKLTLKQLRESWAQRDLTKQPKSIRRAVKQMEAVGCLLVDISPVTPYLNEH